MAEKQSQAIVVKADIQDQFNQHLQSQFNRYHLAIWLRQLVSTKRMGKISLYGPAIHGSIG